jgi:heme A synthase
VRVKNAPSVGILFGPLRRRGPTVRRRIRPRMQAKTSRASFRTPMTAILNPQSQAQGASTQGLGRGPFRLAVALVCWTIVVILKGAMVTSTGSGMAYRDWPKADGQWLPESSYTTLPGFFEHFHRIAGAIAGLLSLTLVVHLWRCKALSSPGGRVAVLGLALIIVQGVVGGVGVLNNTPVALSSLHGTLAQLTIATFAIAAYRLSARWLTTVPTPHPSAGSVRTMSMVAVVALVVQTYIGAIARHSGNVNALWAHVGNALVVFLLVVVASGLAAGKLASVPGIQKLAKVLLWLLVAQLVLGFVALLIRTGKDPKNVEHLLRAGLISSHVLVGSLLTVTASLLAAHVFRGAVRIEAARG